MDLDKTCHCPECGKAMQVNLPYWHTPGVGDMVDTGDIDFASSNPQDAGKWVCAEGCNYHGFPIDNDEFLTLDEVIETVDRANPKRLVYGTLEVCYDGESEDWYFTHENKELAGTLDEMQAEMYVWGVHNGHFKRKPETTGPNEHETNANRLHEMLERIIPGCVKAVVEPEHVDFAVTCRFTANDIERVAFIADLLGVIEQHSGSI